MHIPIVLKVAVQHATKQRNFMARNVPGDDFSMLPAMLPIVLWISLLSVPADIGRIPCHSEIMPLQPPNKEYSEVVLYCHKLGVVYPGCFVELFAGCYNGHPNRREPKNRLILRRLRGLFLVAAINHPMDFGLNTRLSTALLPVGQDWPTTMSV